MSRNDYAADRLRSLSRVYEGKLHGRHGVGTGNPIRADVCLAYDVYKGFKQLIARERTLM